MKLTFTNDSATIGTSEYSLPADSTTLAAQTDDCVLEGWIDVGAMLAGDEYQIKLYEKINGGTQRVVWSAYPIGAQPGPIVVPRYYVGEGWDLTVKKLAGTDRSIGWSLRKEIEGETVVTGSISAGAITAAAIATDAIDADAIADNAINAGAIASGAITSAKFAAGAIDAAAIADGAIDAGAIASDAITSAKIADNAITANKIAAAAITSGKFAAGAIDAAAIADGAIDAGAIADGAIDAGALASGTITAAKFAAGAIDAAAIADGAIDAGAIASDAITSAKIADGAITANKIATGAITSGKFAAGAIDAAAIATDAIDADAIKTDAINEIQSGLALSTQVDTVEASLAAIEADTQDIQSRLPAALLGGRMDATIGAVQADAITAAGLAGDVTTELQAGLATSSEHDDILDAIAAVQTTADAIETDTQDIQSRLPAALVSGRMDSSVGAVQANAITAAGVANDVTTELQSGLATLANQATIISAIAGVQADTDNIQTRLPAALVSGRMDSSVGAMAANTITASAVAADAVNEIQAGLAASSQVDTLEASAAAIEADTQDIQSRLPASLIAGRIDATVGAMQANVITAAALATTAVDEIVAGVFAFAIRSGVTFIGLARRLHALSAGKATGLNSGTVRFYDTDETTVLVEADQSVALGTRDKATIAGD